MAHIRAQQIPRRHSNPEYSAGFFDPGFGYGDQFARAMAELGVRLIFARSPQAKGRVERMAGTFQDRLVTELRLASATTIAEAQTGVRHPRRPRGPRARRAVHAGGRPADRAPRVRVHGGRRTPDRLYGDAGRALTSHFQRQAINLSRQFRPVESAITFQFLGSE